MRVHGIVKKAYPFGMFVAVAEFPDVTVTVDAASYAPKGEITSAEQWPPIGSPIEGVVVDHVEHNHQVKLRVE